MQVSLTIIRYPKIYIPFAFLAMAIFRLPLWFKKEISFFKLMGSGKNGTFDKQPDLQQWAILAAHPHSKVYTGNSYSPVNDIIKPLYGKFIEKWLHFFNCETFTILLSPLEGRGLWDGKKVFGELNEKIKHEGVIATLTRATIRLHKLKYFWQNVAAVANKMTEAKGFITSLGIGEIPWIKQATFSVWETEEDMKVFAYGMREHKDVIKKTKQQKWYSEEMFVRFKITACLGTLKNKNPLHGKI